jgi:2-C-methyl-D-erythritol 4-phosphate cytidylyltransferase
VSSPSLKVVVAITSPIAFQELKSQSIIQTCLENAGEFVAQYGSTAHLAIAGTKESLAQLLDVDCEKLECELNNAQEFARSLRSAQPAELVMIHDSQRALTTGAQFDRVLRTLTPNIDAVRPVSAFTETLKSISADQYIEDTIDRNSMKRVSTPELIRFSAIDFEGMTSTWFVPIKAAAKITTVEADPESARINSEKEIDLMKHLFGRN